MLQDVNQKDKQYCGCMDTVPENESEALNPRSGLHFLSWLNATHTPLPAFLIPAPPLSEVSFL